MRKFLIKLSWWVLALVFMSCFLDVVLSRVIKKSNHHAQGEFSTWNDVLEGKIKAKIIINGSSRAWVQINPTMIENELHVPTYNLGLDGHNFRLQNLRYQFFLKKNPQPKLIIYSVDSGTLYPMNELYNPNQFLPYMFWNTSMKETLEHYQGYTFWDYYIPLLRYTGKPSAFFSALKIILLPQTNTVKRIKGYQANKTSWNSDFENAQKKMLFFEPKQDPDLIKSFDRFLQESLDNNMHVVLVYPPEYIEGQKFIQNRESEIMARYKNWSSKYKIPFFDFSNDSLCLDKKYFYNATHLNQKGSEIYTRQLIDSLKKEALSNPRLYQ